MPYRRGVEHVGQCIAKMATMEVYLCDDADPDTQANILNPLLHKAIMHVFGRGGVVHYQISRWTMGRLVGYANNRPCNVAW